MELLIVPLGVLVLAGLLALATWLEHSVVSPRALITSAARAKCDPDIAERLVAVEAERLLSRAAPVPPPTGRKMTPESG